MRNEEIFQSPKLNYYYLLYYYAFKRVRGIIGVGEFHIHDYLDFGRNRYFIRLAVPADIALGI